MWSCISFQSFKEYLLIHRLYLYGLDIIHSDMPAKDISLYMLALSYSLGSILKAPLEPDVRKVLNCFPAMPLFLLFKDLLPCGYMN